MVVEEPRWVLPYQPAKIILRNDLLAISRISEPAMPELSTRSVLETVATPAAEKGTQT